MAIYDHVQLIRNAIYGRDVRDAIADSIEECYSDTQNGVTLAEAAAGRADAAKESALTAVSQANAAKDLALTAAGKASNVDALMTSSGDTATLKITNADGVEKTVTITQPSVTVSKVQDGPYHLAVTNVDGSSSGYDILDPAAEVKKKANLEAVTVKKTVGHGDFLTFQDGVDAPAVKTTIRLEPKQDLHGYDHPWVGGAGKNLIGIEDYTLIKSSARTKSVTLAKPLPAGDYIFSWDRAGTSRRCKFTFRDGSNAKVGEVNMLPYLGGRSSVTVTVSAEATAIYTYIEEGEDGDVDATITNVMLTASTEADQSFEPYENICPIEGYEGVTVRRTGKNLLTLAEYGWSNGTGALGPNVGALSTPDLIPTYPGAAFTYYKNVPTETSKSLVMRQYNANKEYIGNGTGFGNTRSGYKTEFVPEGCYYVAFTQYGALSTEGLKVQVEKGGKFTGYEAPDGHAYQISFSSVDDGTVYSGTVELNEDGSGTVTLDRYFHVFDGTESIGYLGSNSKFIRWSGDRYPPTINGSVADFTRSSWCSHAIIKQITTTNSAIGGYVYSSASGNAAYIQLRLPMFAEWTQEEAQQYVIDQYNAGTPITMGYTMGTPITHQLTATQIQTLFATNHIWLADGEISLNYRADRYTQHLEKYINTLPVATASGTIASFDDGADDIPFEQMTINIEPAQAGTGDPSPENVRPITGWDSVLVRQTGKNLLGQFAYVDGSTSGIAYTKNLNDGSITGVGTSSGTGNRDIDRSLMLPPGSYILSGGTANVQIRVNLYRSDGSLISRNTCNADPVTVTVTEDTAQIVTTLGFVTANTVVNDTVYPMLRKASITDGTYEPYHEENVYVDLKKLVGNTVYGGTMTINKDGSGSLAVTHVYFKLDGVNNVATVLGSGTVNWMYKFVTNVPHVNSGTPSSIMCSHYPVASVGNTTTAQGIAVVTDGTIRIRTDQELSAEAYNAYLAEHPIDVVYYLTTPILYNFAAEQLSTILGINTVRCNAGGVTVNYRADIQRYINNLIAAALNT